MIASCVTASAEHVFFFLQHDAHRRQLTQRHVHRAVDGDVDFGSVMAGQIAGLVNKHQSAAEIMVEIISDAEATIRNMYGRIH